MNQKTLIRLSYLFVFLVLFSACKKDKPKPKPVNKPTIAAPATPVAEAGTHIVAQGETLYEVAKQYGLTVQELKNLNPSLKDDKNWKVGLKLDVEKPEINPATVKTMASNPTPPKSNTTSTEDKSKWRYYTLQDGETLYRVSKKHDISVEALLKLNPILKNKIDDLPVGQRIRVR